MSKALRIIPDSITSMNLLSGSVGVILCLGGHLEGAFVMMLVAAVFDFFDGLSARMLGVSSDIGKELDSLADVVSFGLLPALMLYETMNLSPDRCWTRFIPLVLVAFSALRLAKFNLDERQHLSFIGLPTPASATVCGSIASLAARYSGSGFAAICCSTWFLPLISIILSALLISEIPMFSMKFGKLTRQDRKAQIIRGIFLAITAVSALLVIAAHAHWSLIPLAVFTIYILINLIIAIIP